VDQDTVLVQELRRLQDLRVVPEPYQQTALLLLMLPARMHVAIRNQYGLKIKE